MNYKQFYDLIKVPPTGGLGGPLFKTAWRSLVRGKGFSVINISGLAVGMAAAILIMLWLQHEISFDKFHNNKDRLYEVYGLTTMEGKLSTINQTGQPLAPASLESSEA